MKKLLMIIPIILIFYIYHLLPSSTFVNPKDYEPFYLSEYNQLKNDYELLSEHYDFIPAEVISSGILKINNLFLINKGLNDGVNEKSFVVNSEGLVGIIVKTFNNFSIVRTIFSDKTRIAIETNDCYGSLFIKNGNFIIHDLINCDNVNINDSVFTSKYNYSSSNIPIGYISKIDHSDLYIKPYVNIYKIKYVGVINDS